MSKISVWKTASEQPSFPALNGPLTVDVAIVGGGISGLTAAYLLSKGGKKVAVLEARSIGEGSTGYSTGNLYSTIGGEGLHSVKSKWNESKLREVVESRASAVGLIEETIKKFGIDCGFQRVPWCLFTEDEKGKSYIEKEKEAMEKAGLATSSDIPFPIPVNYGVRIDNQAQFNPLQYVKSLAKNIQSDNCLIFENTQVTNVHEGEKCTVETIGGNVEASQVVMTTHTPKGLYLVHTSLGPYREYAVAVKLHGAYPDAGIYWDMLESEHYSMRTYDTPEGKVLMILGEMHKVGQKKHNNECFDRLEAFLRKRFEVASVAFKWAAQQYKPADGIPYIGKSSGESKTYIATGFGADGLTYGTLAAMIISDEIMGKENKWSKTYDASRLTPIASAKEFAKENVNVAAQYLKDWLPFAYAKDFEEIKAGEGKVISHNGEKLAAFRDTDNQLHVCSAICTHLACVVHWNEAELSWDCPCHGSRFDREGKVLEGPALLNLAKKSINH